MDWLKKLKNEGCCGDVESHGYIYMGVSNVSSPRSSPLLDNSPGAPEEASKKENTTIKNPNEGLLRPPRKLSGIFSAGVMVVLGALFGAIAGYFAWNQLDALAAPVCVDMGRRKINARMMGVDMQHMKAAAMNLLCDDVRSSWVMQAGWCAALACAVGVGFLRLSYGRAYFALWGETESLTEMERLYCCRTYGSLLVLTYWRTRVWLLFTFQIVFLLWFRYQVDLFMDLKAMYIFWQREHYQWLVGNCLGVALGLCWTLVEIFKALNEDRENKIATKTQILMVGVTLPLLGLHVTYLSALSLWQGAQHPFLFISTLAEAILESAVSSMVQTYAVIFSDMNVDDKASLYESIGISFVSIGYAFSSLDEAKGGDLLAKLPGYCKSQIPQWWAIFFFRVCEVTSRMTSLMLFQLVFKGATWFYIMSADFAVLILLVIVFQYQVGAVAETRWGFVVSNLFYTIPSVICLMAPMLETDCVLTVPPGVYYLLRVVELGVMIYLSGEKFEWELTNFQEMFADDGLMTMACVFSTVMMLVLLVLIRGFLVLRVLLEASKETWTLRPFNAVQQALRNGILLASDGDLGDEKMIEALMERNPGKRNFDYRNLLLAQGETKAACSKKTSEWEAKYLRAKVSMFVEEGLASLAAADEQEGGAGHVRVAKRRNKRMERQRSTRKLTGEQNSAIDASGAMNTGVLVAIRGPGGAVSTKSDVAQMDFADDKCDQKFTIEAVDSECKRIALRSGDAVKLRCLQNGKFLGVVPRDYRKDDGVTPMGPYTAEFPERFWKPNNARMALATKWIITLVYEHVYISIRRFKSNVEMVAGSLEVSFLKHHDERHGRPKPELWNEYGWKIMSINEKPATLDRLQEMLATGKDFDDTKSEASSVDGPVHYDSAMALKPGQYRVAFEKMVPTKDEDGNSSLGTPLTLGSKIILRSASGWVEAPLGVAGVSNGGIDEMPQGDIKAAASADAKMLRVEAGKPGAIFSLESTDFVSKDDPYLYSWTSEQIRTGRKKMDVSASLAEKYRMTVVVAYNARTQHVAGNKQVAGILHANQKLHKRLLYHLARIITPEMEVKAEYENMREAHGDYTFFEGADTDPLVIKEFTDPETCLAFEQGVKVGDTLNLIEITEVGRQSFSIDDCAWGSGAKKHSRIICCPKHMRKVLEEYHSDQEHYVTFWFTCQAPQVAKSDVLKTAVVMGEFIATLLPTWKECMASDLDQEGEPGTIKSNFMNTRSFFNMKCDLVTSIIRNGWELMHEGFATAAIALQERMDVYTASNLMMKDMFPEARHSVLREKILIHQLKVLSTAWKSLPRSVKEGNPKVLQKLFRCNVELQAMFDAVQVLFDKWKKDTQDFKQNAVAAEIFEMPSALHEFFMNVKPEDEESLEGNENSVVWIHRAYDDLDEEDKVSDILRNLKSYHRQAENYWRSQVDGAGQKLENATKFLTSAKDKEAGDKGGIKVVLISNDEDLKKIQDALDDKLVITSTFPVGEKAGTKTIKQGEALLNLGQVKDVLQGRDIKGRLMELRSDKKDVRLLFSAGDFDSHLLVANQALHDLAVLVKAVKKASLAFPERVGEEFDKLQDSHRRGELQIRDIESQRTRQAQEKELDEALSMAERRMQDVQVAKKRLEEQNGILVKRQQKLEEEKETLQGDKDQLETDKTKLLSDKANLEKQKNVLEGEKTQLTNTQAALQNTYNVLMTEKAKVDGEKRKLDMDFQQLEEEKNELKAKKVKQEQALRDIDAYFKEREGKVAAAPASAGAEAAAPAEPPEAFASWRGLIQKVLG